MDFGQAIESITKVPWNPGCSQTKMGKEQKGILTCAARLKGRNLASARCSNQAKYKLDNMPLCGVHLKQEMRPRPANKTSVNVNQT